MPTKTATPTLRPRLRSPSVLRRFRGVVVVIAGLWLVGVAVTIGNHAQRFIQRSEVVSGEVVKLDFGPAHGEVRFAPRQGGIVTYSQNGEVWLHPGQGVRVRYDPARPNEGPVVDQPGAIWGPTIIVAALGVIFMAVGAALLRHAWRTRAR
ncbi:DUF3592 domain-containing protein [Caulobacter sp. S45]|jgi:hypothetical protein|uniref:DUF3592 domain-containing protein n=1 Tax=Caulobacter sp. S45 TaxID=1641861 RepID=UPI00131B7E95|nr:DUF3592 domain-containing protein [Caulobacter sp. S45]